MSFSVPVPCRRHRPCAYWLSGTQVKSTRKRKGHQKPCQSPLSRPQPLQDQLRDSPRDQTAIARNLGAEATPCTTQQFIHLYAFTPWGRSLGSASLRCARGCTHGCCQLSCAWQRGRKGIGFWGRGFNVSLQGLPTP